MQLSDAASPLEVRQHTSVTNPVCPFVNFLNPVDMCDLLYLGMWKSANVWVSVIRVFQIDEFENDDTLIYNTDTGNYTLRSTRNSLTPSSNGFLHPGEMPTRPKSAANSSNKSGGMMGLFRRNTAELAATIRERYQGNRSESATTDRPDVEHRGETPPPTPNEGNKVQKAGRSHSVKGSFIRRFAKSSSSKEKKEVKIEVDNQSNSGIERSRSFHSHISEEGMLLGSKLKSFCLYPL